MKIIIAEDAARYYRLTSIHKFGQYNEEYCNKLEKLQNQEIEVETTHLFSDQFNIDPIHNVSTSGMRIMGQSVYRVIDDERIGLYTNSKGEQSKNKQEEFIKDPYLKKFVIHPNPFVSEGGVFLWEVYLNDLVCVNQYLRFCKEFGTQPDSEFVIE